jgi:catechol 2,3-dioxygenase-like lactoylglutathione lyase family enzyme
VGRLPRGAGGQRHRRGALPQGRRRPRTASGQLRHVAFRTSRRGLETAKAELGARGIAFEERDYGVAWSVYLPDPDGHPVEITTYQVSTGTGREGS